MINFISKNATAASQLEKKVNSNGYFNGQNINYNWVIFNLQNTCNN